MVAPKVWRYSWYAASPASLNSTIHPASYGLSMAPPSPPPVSIPAHDVAPPQLAPPAASRATDATPPPALPPPPSAPSTAVGSAANSPFSLCPPSAPPCLTSSWLSPSCS
ncbi:unnamed protein product [Closterium sp. Naga37s-1]|nr:unnamed protein product [Closterium sp. Naga37s-1]